MIKLKSLLREDPASDVQDLITKVKNYDEFVRQLGDMAKDKKVQAFIQSGKADGDLDDDRLNAVKTAIAVRDLRPTQNEIDVNGSLRWPLTKPDSLRNCLQKGVVTIKAPIVTYNGQYIIDGHHRWSQLYAMNKDAVINAVDLQGPKMNPIDVLKIVQLAIAGDLGTVPTQSVQGQNLLKADGKFVADYVIKTITDECVKVFAAMRGKTLGEATKQTVSGKIVVPNVMEMQKTSQPVPGAPKRDVMPQTDDATNAMLNISKGVVNYNAPYQHESKMISLTKLMREQEAPKCPIATQNIDVNIKHRQIAIDRHGYGPLNPNNPNIKFWRAKAQMWKLDSLEEAKAARCNNCAAFNITSRILNCIEAGLASGEKEVEPDVQPKPDVRPRPEPKPEMSRDTDVQETFKRFKTLAKLREEGEPIEKVPAQQSAPEPELDDTEDVGAKDAWDTIEAGKLGYCTMHKFKCAGSRTCNAWIEGGPVKDK